MSNGNAFTDGRDGAIRALAGRGWLIGALVVLVGGAGYAYGAISPASYTANAYLVVSPLSAEAGANGTSPDAQGFATAFTRIAGQPQIQAQAAQYAGVSLTTMIKESVASTSPDAPMIDISGVDSNPNTAAAVANGLARALVQTASTQTANTSVTVSILSSAVPPVSPSSTSPAVDAGVGAAAGVLLGSLFGLAGVKLPGRGRSERRQRAESAGPGAPWPPAAEPDDDSPLDAADSRTRAKGAAAKPVIAPTAGSNDPAQAETIQMSALGESRLSMLDPKGAGR